LRGQGIHLPYPVQLTSWCIWFDNAAGSDRAISDRALGTLTAKYDEFVEYQIAEVHAWRRKPDLALALVLAAIQRAWDGLDPGLTGLKTDPLFAPIRFDLRYGEWLRKIGIT
jgi:hypothetical protein